MLARTHSIKYAKMLWGQSSTLSLRCLSEQFAPAIVKHKINKMKWLIASFYSQTCYVSGYSLLNILLALLSIKTLFQNLEQDTQRVNWYWPLLRRGLIWGRRVLVVESSTYCCISRSDGSVIKYIRGDQIYHKVQRARSSPHLYLITS